MKFIILLISLIAYSLCATDCSGGPSVGEGVLESLTKPKKDLCKTMKVCHSSCREFSNGNENCSAKRIGILIKDARLYKRACQLRSKDKNDNLLKYLKKVKINGRFIQKLPRLFNYFKGWIRNIRRYDWCTKDGKTGKFHYYYSLLCKTK
jgi:hypothetical protein